jgi:hypothetical protein
MTKPPPPAQPRPIAGRLTAALGAAFLLCALPGPALANQPEARDVARAANCQPGKVETVRQLVGGSGETIYRIACSGSKNLSVLVQCRLRQCVLLR